MPIMTENPYKDLPKISFAPKPEELLVWTVYVDHSSGKARARLHRPGKFNEFWGDGPIDDPLAFCEVVDKIRELNR